jgi:hypothetical protein
MVMFDVTVKLGNLAAPGRAEGPFLVLPRDFLALFHERMGNFTLPERVIQSMAPFGICVR